MLIGFIAIDQYNDKIALTDKKHPRKQLLKKLSVKSCRKIYRDIDGKEKHVGYIIGNSWYEIFEIHEWKG
jgi:hypothetical protein